MNAKIMNYHVIPDSFTKAGSTAKRVLVGGCFDLFHFGHLTFLQESKKEGNELIIALESDEFIQKRKKRDPIHTQDQRAAILASLTFVDYVILLPFMSSGEDYSQLVKRVQPTVIAVTKGDKNIEQKKLHAQTVHAEVREVIAPVSSLSSSGILSYATLFSD